MSEHDRSQLGAYVLGALEPDEARAVDEHLAGCAECRDELAEFEVLKGFLAEVPPEAFLDGPPADGDLLLQRTVREVRTAGADRADGAAAPAPRRRPNWLLAAAGVIIIAAAALGGGVLIGRGTADPVATPSVQVPAGTREARATDAGTGATMATSVEPRAGWTWVNVQVSGLAAGYRCELRVIDKAGNVFVAGSWLISDKAAREGATFSGGVVVPADQVKAVDLVTLQGRHVVTTPL